MATASNTHNTTNGEDSKPRIGEMLVAEGLITEADLHEALNHMKTNGGKTVETLISLEHLKPQDFVRFLAKQPGMAAIDLPNYTIPRELLELIPAQFARAHQILPLDVMRGALTVGMACPLDSKTIDELKKMTGYQVKPLLVSMNDVLAALNHYYPSSEKQQPFSLADDPRWGGKRAGKASATPTPPPQKEEEPVAAPVEASSANQQDLSRVESALTFEGILHLVRSIKSLPALPETVTQVREALEDENMGMAEVAGIITRDPGLSARLIGLANSSAYALPHRIDSVERACSLLGLNEVYSVVLGASVVNYFDTSKKFDYRKFWQRSLLCATAARIIAKLCGRTSTKGLFTAGLLHDLGRAVLAEVAPERYASLNHQQEDDALIQEEERVFGIAHPEIGFILADSWKLPEEITLPIRFHHRVEQATDMQGLVAVVGLAARMADAYGRITPETVDDFAKDCRECVQLLDLDDGQFASILNETAQAFRQELARQKAQQK